MQSNQETLVTGVLVINDTERSAAVGLLAKNKDGVLNVPSTQEECTKNENKYINVQIYDENTKDRKISVSDKDILRELAKGKYKDGDRVVMSVIIEKRLVLKNLK